MGADCAREAFEKVKPDSERVATARSAGANLKMPFLPRVTSRGDHAGLRSAGPAFSFQVFREELRAVADALRLQVLEHSSRDRQMIRTFIFTLIAVATSVPTFAEELPRAQLATLATSNGRMPAADHSAARTHAPAALDLTPRPRLCAQGRRRPGVWQFQ